MLPVLGACLEVVPEENSLMATALPGAGELTLSSDARQNSPRGTERTASKKGDGVYLPPYRSHGALAIDLVPAVAVGRTQSERCPVATTATVLPLGRWMAAPTS